MKTGMFLSCAALALSTGVAAAQTHDSTAIEEIVVTAQKRSENLQDVPVSVTALTSDALAARGVNNVLALNNLAPGMRISAGDAAANPKIYIRGVGLSDFNPNASSGVGVYADGVYVGSPLAQMAGFFDLAQVEVLRGPQGTLYGRNTNGGAINITTKRPSQSFGADASLEYGSFNAVTADLGVGGPIVADKLAFRAAAQYVKDDGYTYNRVTGHDLNAAKHWAGRLSLLYTPSEDFELLTQVNRYVNRGDATAPGHRALFPATPGAAGPDGFCATSAYASGQCADLLGYADTDNNPRAVDANQEGKDKVDLFGASSQATWTLGGMSLISVTAWQWAHRNDVENTDASPLRMIEINYRSRQHQFTQELRLQSNDPSARLNWVLGVYYMDEQVRDNTRQDVLRDLRPLFTTPENPTGLSLENSVATFGYPYTQTTKGYAVFGQADYKLTDRLTGTVGLRWSADDKSMDYQSQAEDGLIVILTSKQSKTFSAVSGRLGLRYALSDDANIYATYNRGYKSGGFFGGMATTPQEMEPYDNETLDAYELGLKSEFFDRRVRLNVSGFYYDYKNQQVFAQTTRNGLTVLVLDNAANSKVYGGEAEVTARPIQPLTLSAGVSLLHAKYGDYFTEGKDFTGNWLPQSPKVTFNVAATWVAPLANGASIVANVDANYSSRIYFDNSNAARLSQDAVWLAGAQVSWRSPDQKIEAGAFARNLFDKTYAVSISNIDSLGVDLLSYNRPQSLGVFLRYHY
ncbi:TonB-dependent receptor [Caulobacter segnis]|uniref:TonB-dependent receptor n=1 Tax=Caulobacter segnis TaxID=88688 RepID=UPI00286537C3|nr:TonB-dependent receptor [Caulobacter segnis]MDR6625006.1 iron complex outermembrane receptor protein [Caulobacter segnis]